jgi:hypothetical protein
VFYGYQREPDTAQALILEQDAHLETILASVMAPTAAREVKDWLSARLNGSPLDDTTLIKGWEIALHVQGADVLIGVSYQP